MKILNGVLSFIFILFAAVQYNDPDPLMWMLVYGGVAAVCAFAMIRKFNKYIILAGLGACLAGALYYFPGVIELFSEHEIGDLTRKMKADQPFIERSRESLGLIIAFLVLLYQYFQMKKYQRSEASE